MAYNRLPNTPVRPTKSTVQTSAKKPSPPSVGSVIGGPLKSAAPSKITPGKSAMKPTRGRK